MRTQFTAAQRLLGTEPNRAWRRPLLLIALTPIVTVPLTLVLTELLSSRGGCYSLSSLFGGVIMCPPLPAGLMLLPGLINLAPAWWLLSRDDQTRLAASVATVLGGLRFGVPLLVMLSAAAHVEGHRSFEVVAAGGALTPSFPNTWAVTRLSTVLWIITLVAQALVGWAGSRHTLARAGAAFTLPLGVALAATGLCIAALGAAGEQGSHEGEIQVVVVDAGNLGPPDYPSSTELRLDSTTQVFTINRHDLPDLPNLRTGERIRVWTYEDYAYEQVLVYQLRTPDGTWVDYSLGNPTLPISPLVADLQWPLLGSGTLLTIGSFALWTWARLDGRLTRRRSGSAEHAGSGEV